jgi:DNA-binding PadR family transcriptional regulator
LKGQSTMNTVEQILHALQAYGLKQEGTGKYRCNSPFRAGSDSMGFTLTLKDGRLVGCDHADGGRGYNQDEIARQLGIATGEKATIATTKRVYNGLADYAAAHGLTAEQLTAAGWQETTYQGHRALSFQTLTGVRHRLLDVEKGVYRSPNGYKRCWYRLDDALGLARLSGELVICNGEISTVAAQWHGIGATCITAGEKDIPAEQLKELKQALVDLPHVQLVIALDCDGAGRQAAQKQLQTLKSAGLNVKAVDLGLGSGGDLADFCLLYGVDASSRLKDLPLLFEDDKPALKFYTIEDLFALPPLKWLIAQHFVAGGLGVVYGRAGSGKSFYMLDHALKLASSRLVVYVAGEGLLGYQQRVRAWLKYHDQQPPSGFRLLGELNLFDEGSVQLLEDALRGQSPALIVVDTLATASGDADENSTRDMNRLIAHCKRLMQTTGAAVVLVHHTGKEGRTERGSSALRGAADTMIRLSDDDGIITVECEKTKDAEPFKPYGLKKVIVGVGYQDGQGQDVNSVVLIPASLNRTELSDRDLDVLDMLAIEPTATLESIARQLNIGGDGKGAVYRIVKRLTKHGLLTVDGREKRVTSDGLQRLAEREGEGAAADVPTPSSRKVEQATMRLGDEGSRYYQSGL